MRGPAPHTAEDATIGELWRISWRLLLMLGVLGFIVFPIIRDLPLGQSTRIGMLAWLLVGFALYWLYAGMGYRPLLLLQLLLFSSAATLLSAKLLLVAIDVRSLSLLRSAARVLIVVGAACAGVNALGMLAQLVRRRRGASPP